MIETQLTRIENKLDKMYDKQAEHGEILSRHEVLHSRNSDDLEEHIRGVKALESRVEPIEKHVADVQRFFKRMLWIAGGVASLAGPLINHFLEKLTK